jgi:hypothetical protein
LTKGRSVAGSIRLKVDRQACRPGRGMASMGSVGTLAFTPTVVYPEGLT